ncbi:MAG: RNA polymerase sigma factor [Gemmatimonadetes bacterium]|nr:RNA polymerase sigma factor [Gemmatimonadota bacterium]NNM06249.1 RNA polymerase sigma factor [Gemmatimonadota bacterium]
MRQEPGKGGIKVVRKHPKGPDASARSKLSDPELIADSLSAAPGDTRDFDELVRRHQGHIRANCRFIVKDPEAALDLAQEVFVKAYFARSGFEERATFRTWLRRIKVNQCLSFRESRWSRSDWSLDAPGLEDEPNLRVAPTAHEDVEKKETGERVMRTLDRIPDTLRIPLVLKDMDGFSNREIQELLGIGLSAVKMRISRGREAFRAAWEADWEEER